MAKCFFSDKEVVSANMQGFDGTAFKSDFFGEYFLSRQAFSAYDSIITPKHKILCLQETIKLNNEGLTPFWVVDDRDIQQPLWGNVVFRRIGDFEKKKTTHEHKEHEIISILSQKASESTNPFEFHAIPERDLISIGVFSDLEFAEWIKSLYRDSLVDLSDEAQAALKSQTIGRNPMELLAAYLKKGKSIRLTNKGWKFSYQLKSRSTTRQVFIAMAFTDHERKDLPSEMRDKFKSALTELDWKPIIVDEVPHNEGVMDKIIASINESRFVIADLTYHKSGVYLEAGYAKGKGLPVIFTVRKDHLDGCHFDVKHLNLIVWTDLEDLKNRLSTRIRATIT